MVETEDPGRMTPFWCAFARRAYFLLFALFSCYGVNRVSGSCELFWVRSFPRSSVTVQITVVEEAAVVAVPAE